MNLPENIILILYALKRAKDFTVLNTDIGQFLFIDSLIDIGMHPQGWVQPSQLPGRDTQAICNEP